MKENIKNSQIGIIGRNIKVNGGIHYHYSKSIPLQYPPKVKHFTGRDKEKQKILQILQFSNKVIINGTGGIGKSALASKIIWELAPNNKPCNKFPDGIIHHDFSTNPNINHAFEHILRSFGEEPKPTPEIAAKRLLSNKYAIVLLDSTENTRNLSILLNMLSNSCIIVTTKNKDSFKEIFEIKPLSLELSIKLFLKWNKGIEDIEYVKKICILTGGSPLYICIASRYLLETKENPSEYIEWFENKLIMKNKLENIQFFLKNIISHLRIESINVLSIAGILAFDSVNNDVFQKTINDASIKKNIEELVNFGLFNINDERIIFSSVLIYNYVRENTKLNNNIFKRIVKYYMLNIEKHKKQNGKDNKFVDIERKHIIQVMKECKNREMWDLLNILIWEIKGYYYISAYWNDLAIIQELAIESSQNKRDLFEEGWHLCDISYTYICLGQIKKSIEFAEKSLSIFRLFGIQEKENECLRNIGIAYYELYQYEKSISYHKKALEISRRLKHKQDVCLDLGNLANAYKELGSLDKAVEFYEQSLILARQIGDWQAVGLVIGNIGIVYSKLNQQGEAIKLYKESLSINEKNGYKYGQIRDLQNIGIAYKKIKKFEKAIDYYSKALSIQKEIDYKQHGTENILLNISLCFMELSKFEKAKKYQEQALAISKKNTNKQGEGAALDKLGVTYFNLGQVDKAIEHTEKALSICRKISDLHLEETVLANLAIEYSELGHFEKVIEYCEQGLTISKEIGHRQGEAVHLTNIGKSYNSLGLKKKAKKYLKVALKIFEEIKSPDALLTKNLLNEL